jgi:hypothetical protein
MKNINLITNFKIKFYEEISIKNLDKMETKFELITNNFLGKTIENFFCEWLNIYGTEYIIAQQKNVEYNAKIRMVYNPFLYTILKKKYIYIAKNGENIFKDDRPDKNNTNCFVIFGTVENIREQNKIMEFKVRRYEGK